MLSKEAANYIINAVHSGLNIAVIGATGTGKTTFLKTLCELHDPIAFRQVIVEDTRELSIFPNHPNPNVVYLNTRLGNNDGLTEINQSECVANSLRMRPDSISLGEARKGEVFDFLSAMSTGHGYGKLSFHADGPKFVNQRLTFMASMNPACSFVPLSQVAQMVALSINIIVYIEIEHGKRHIESITEHTGIVNYPQPNVFSPEQNTVFQWNHETDEMDFINDTVFKKQFARKGISADTLYQGRI
jgi:Flp pilus assembly CpaF family ATPase